MGGIGHTSAPRKKKVIVFMKDHTKIIGKYLKTVDNKIYLEGQEPIPIKKMQTMAIYRDPNSLS